jgi:hypothetical protein
MRYHSITFWLFVAFLAGYFAQKYFAAAPPTYVPAYAITVATICILTALLPFGLTALVADRVDNTAAFVVVALVCGVALSVLGFAGFWYAVISGFPNPPPLMDVAPRGLTPGLFVGAILSIGRVLYQRARKL